MPVSRIDSNSWLLTDHEAVATFGAAIPFNNEDVAPGAIKSESSGDVTARIRQWGKKNNLPQMREDLVSGSNIVPALLNTKRDMLLGAGLMAYRERFEDGALAIDEIDMPPVIASWIEEAGFEKELRSAARELEWHANVFTEFVMDKGGRVKSIRTKECTEVRAEEKTVDNVIKNFYWSAGWGVSSQKEEFQKKIIRIPAYDPAQKQKKFLLHTGNDTCRTDKYYFSPAWWSGWQWIDLANTIPHFHRSNLQHGYTIRYHIEIPEDYFETDDIDSRTPEDVGNALDVQETRKKDLINHLNEFLAGAKNAGRAFVSTYRTDLGKEFPGIKITAIKTDLQDKALIELFTASNQANISAQAIHPVLAAIETQGKLSSGSEIRNAFTMYMAIKAPTQRNILLEPLRLVGKINGWPADVKIGFRDIKLTTLDESKTGTMSEPTPAQ